MDEALIIAHTRQWLKEIVIGLNFCPFANQPFIRDQVRYRVVSGIPLRALDQVITEECRYLAQHPETETTLIILADLLQSFTAFNIYIKNAGKLLERKQLIRDYQLAHFHPEYVFAQHTREDAANYTNRSPYPVLHIIRQQSITEALKKMPGHREIPEANIHTAREAGKDFFREFLRSLTGTDR